MNYKVEKVLKDNKKYLIIFIILWLVIDIVLIAPLAVSVSEATINGKVNLNTFFEEFPKEISSFSSITRAFDVVTVDIFGKETLWMTIIFFAFFIIGIFKLKPKNEYADIEHGSSDWSENGEQYRILNKKEGILLAENNYLPLNKNGNINVLV